MSSSIVKWTRGLTVETVDPRTLSEDRLKELHIFSDALMKEPLGPFLNHVLNHDTVYIFRKAEDGSLVGFSHWRYKDLTSGTSTIKVIIQGKLRILSSYRRLSIHVWAALWYWFKVQWQFPMARIWFISIASLFNYVSMRKSISEFYLMNGKYEKGPIKDLGALQGLLGQMVKEDNFELDKVDPARIYVFIRIPESTLSEFPASFYELPEAQDYIKANPQFREGFDLAYCYPYTLRNILGMFFRGVEQTYWRKFEDPNLNKKKES